MFFFEKVATLAQSSSTELSNNKEVTASGMTVASQLPEEIKLTVTAHAINPEKTTDGTLGFSGENIISEGKIAMPAYSLLDLKDRHILIKIVVPNDYDGTVTITADTFTDYFMDSSHKLLGGTGYGSAQTPAVSYDNCVTSVIGIAAVNASESGGNISVDIDPTPAYNHFANLNDGTYALSRPNITLVDASSDKTIYLLVSYSEERLSYIFSQNIGNESAEGPVNFPSDFSFTVSN